MWIADVRLELASRRWSPGALDPLRGTQDSAAGNDTHVIRIDENILGSDVDTECDWDQNASQHTELEKGEVVIMPQK